MFIWLNTNASFLKIFDAYGLYDLICFKNTDGDWQVTFITMPNTTWPIKQSKYQLNKNISFKLLTATEVVSKVLVVS